MIYVALLRGINVGGNSKVEMSRLKALFEKLGFGNVRTYINSGNIIFESAKSSDELTVIIDNAIKKEFGIPVITTIRNSKEIKKLAEAIPSHWVNDTTMKTDVMFLWKEVDSKKTLQELSIKPEIDEVMYKPGAIVWRVDKKNVTKSGLTKIVGTSLYKKMTVRNINTLRKLYALMEK